MGRWMAFKFFSPNNFDAIKFLHYFYGDSILRLYKMT